MRVAVFSDVHGNLSGLTAVLDSIHRLGADRVIFAGDLCLLGPRPAACVTAMRQLGIEAIYGNTDEWVIGRQPAPEHLRETAKWTLAQLSDDHRKWLARLPFAQHVNPTDNPADELLVVHANPLDVSQIIYPPESDQFKRYGQIRQSDGALAPLVSATLARTIAYGHLHIPSKRNWGEKLLVNVGSVSMPGDGDSRAKYALFTWRNGRWQVQHEYITYDVREEADAFKQYQPPGWETAVGQIDRDGIYYPQKV